MEVLYHSPFGPIHITANEKGLIALHFVDSNFEIKNHHSSEVRAKKNLDKAIIQLDEYFQRNRQEFEIPLFLMGTEFEIAVWNEIQKIPYGRTSTYKEIAEKIGNPNAFRAVGNAANKNHIAIIIPCHRVIGSNGNLRGYAAGLKKKRQLLYLETHQV